VSAARPLYGVAGIVAASEQPRERSPLLPLLLIFVALSAATVWYVALPAFAKEPQATRTCEVIVLQSGSTKCVRNPVRAAHATPRTPKHATR
jgi:hypothetical protein